MDPPRKQPLSKPLRTAPALSSFCQALRGGFNADLAHGATWAGPHPGAWNHHAATAAHDMTHTVTYCWLVHTGQHTTGPFLTCLHSP